MDGQIISLDVAKKQGQVQQFVTERVFPFDFKVYDGEEKELKIELEVEFSVENRVVSKMSRKISVQEQDAIPVTKSATDCVNEYFARENGILVEHQEFVDNNPELDFMRMRRFLFTAYNDLCDLDSMLENKELRAVKHEVASLYRDYEEYIKKTQYPLPYCFEQIFIRRQVEYTHLEQHIEDIKIAMNGAKGEVEVLGRRLEEEEKNLKFIADKKSAEFLEQEKEVKALRRRYVDLIDYIARQKDVIAYETERMKVFRETHLAEFAETFEPMTASIKTKFIKLLNTKGYGLDKEMWARAKTNQYVKKFFRDADIHGGYNSVTYLRYFLKGLDKNKVSSPATKELFNLLKTLEDSSRRNIMVLQENDTKTFKSRQLIERVDKGLKITTSHDPFDALGKLASSPQDIVVLDYKINGLLAFDFIREYRDSPKFNKRTSFIVVTPNQLEYDKIEEGRGLGVEYFVIANDGEAFSDAVRMAI
ncbi:hypothetical protein DCO58_09450 [Helicobacter saguini]|uniref:Response regulator n=2 Tax=Helicobacter saguini TaxID=1548018 RepID=A0A4U8T581_9HELI|nr:response regulator [Helicobacter saguini]MWV67871.1 hypothetical protein [Helicobacter saguini]TLD94700.1 response regulator [Helicobacter saguini]